MFLVLFRLFPALSDPDAYLISYVLMLLSLMLLLMMIVLMMLMKMMFCFSGTLIVREGGLAINQAALMFGSKVLPVPHQVLHISKPTFSPFFPRAHILHISASLTSTQFLSGPRKSRWFIILPGVNFTCEFAFDAAQHRCYEKLLLSAAELKLIPAKKCHLFGADKKRGLSHLIRNVNPWLMSCWIKRRLINVKSCTLEVLV